MKKFSIGVAVLLLLGGLLIGESFPAYAQAVTATRDPASTQQTAAPQTFTSNQKAPKEDFLKARVIEVITEGEETGLDGVKTYLQTFKLLGLEDPWKNKQITIKSSEFNIIGKDAYKKNDVLLVSHSKDDQDGDHFVIVDYVREPAIYLLGFLFIGLVILVGKMKGVKALIALALSFLVIIFFIIPQIAHGANPVLISAIGGILITVLGLYLTYGFKHFSHLSALSIGISLFITVIISEVFTQLTKLTGMSEEQTTYLTQLLGGNFNAKGLLLAGFMIGALGALDDVVVNQVSLVEELHNANAKLSWQELFKKGLKVGVDHISAIVNSLFLAYVGASLPLLLLFSTDQVAQLTFSTTINLEVIAVEIVRTLTGSLGLILAVPISTLIAALYLPKNKDGTGTSTGHVHHSHIH